MSRFWIYLFPCLMDMVLGIVFLAAPVRMARSGAGAAAVANVITAWGLAYIVVCPLVSLIVTVRNAACVLIVGSVVVAVSSLVFIVVPNLAVLYVLMIAIAVGASCFFISFQIFMKAAEKGRPQGVVRSTALYTLSWSTGMGLGALFAGVVSDCWGWQWSQVLGAGLALITGISMFFLRHHAEGDAVAPAVAEDRDAVGWSGINYTRMPDLAWLGWVASGVGCMAVMVVRSVFPSMGEFFNMSWIQQGLVIGLLCLVQGLTGLACFHSRTWMYRAAPNLGLGVLGVVALLLFACGNGAAVFCLAAVLYGVYSGAFFFYLVFHSLTHPSRSSRYIGINEAVVGVASVVGPLVGGLLAAGFSLSVPFYAAAVLVAATLVFQAAVHVRYGAVVRRALDTAP
jgi:MFS family permease